MESMITARPKLMLKLIQANHQGYFDAVQLIYADQLNPDHQLKAVNYFLHHYLQSNEFILSGKIRTVQQLKDYSDKHKAKIRDSLEDLEQGEILV